MAKAYSAKAIKMAEERLKKDGKRIYSIFGQDKDLDSKYRAKKKVKGRVPAEFFEIAIENYPPYGRYLDEAQAKLDSRNQEGFPDYVQQIDDILKDREERLMDKIEILILKMELMERKSEEKDRTFKELLEKYKKLTR